MSGWVVRLVILASTLVLLQGCESGNCRKPQDFEESSKRFEKRIESWLDAADAYEMQRENVALKRAVLLPERKKLVTFRESMTSRMVDALIVPIPDSKVLRDLVLETQRVNMVYAWKLFDVSFEIHRMFTTEQREKLVNAMKQPAETFKFPFLARRAIDYVLFKIDATAAQKTNVWSTVRTTEKRVDKLIIEQRTISDRILAEWTKHQPNKDQVRKDVNLASDSVVRVAVVVLDDAVALSKEFRPEQREFVNDRLVRMKTCPTP